MVSMRLARTNRKNQYKTTTKNQQKSHHGKVWPTNKKPLQLSSKRFEKPGKRSSKALETP